MINKKKILFSVESMSKCLTIPYEIQFYGWEFDIYKFFDFIVFVFFDVLRPIEILLKMNIFYF